MAGSSRSGSSKYPNVATEYAYHGLHDAAASGNVGLAKYALSAGQPVNSALDGVLPIHAACASGSEAVVRLLLSNGADVNAVRLPRKRPHRHKLDKLASPASMKGSSLAMAGTSASVSSSMALTDPIIGRSGATPLHFAAANGHTHIVGLLLTWGAKAEAIDKHGVTPIELAADGGHVDVVSTLDAWIALHPGGSNQPSPTVLRSQVEAATPADLRGEVVSTRFGVHSHASRSNGSFGSTSGVLDEFGSIGPGFASSAPREGSLRRTASAGGSLTLGARPLGTADVLRRIPSRGTTGSKESDHSSGTTSTGFLPPSPHRSRHNPHGPVNPNYSPSDALLPLPVTSERRPSLPDISNPANIPPALLRGSRRPRSAGEDSDGGHGGFGSMPITAAPDGYVRVGRGLRKLGSKGGLLNLFKKPSGDLMALANSGMGASAAGAAAGKARRGDDSSDSEIEDAEGDAGDVDSEGLSSLPPSSANTPNALQTTFANAGTNGSQPDTSSNGSPVQSTLPRDASTSDLNLASPHPYQAATVPGPRPRPRSVSSDLQMTGITATRHPMAALVTPSRAATTTTTSSSPSPSRSTTATSATVPSRSTTATSITTPSRSTTATSASSVTPSRSGTGTSGTASVPRPIPANNRGRKGSEVLAHSPLATEWRHAELSRQTSIDADDHEVSEGEQGLRAVDDGLRAAMADDKMLRPPLSAGSSFLQFDSRSNSTLGANSHAMEEQAEEVASPEPMSAGFQQQQQQQQPIQRGAPPSSTPAGAAPIPVSRRRSGRPSTAESRTESSSVPSGFSGSPPLVSTGHSPGRPGPMRSPSPVRLGLRSPSPFRSGRAPSPHLRNATLNTSPGIRSRALPGNTSPGMRSRALPPSPSMRPKGLGSPAMRANLTLSGSPPAHDGLVVPPSGMRMRSDSAESEAVTSAGTGNGSGRSASGSVSSGGPGHQRRATDGQMPLLEGHTRAQSHDALGIVSGHYQAALNPNLSHTRPRRSTASLSFSSEESGTGSELLDDVTAPLRPTGKRLHSNPAASGGSGSGGCVSARHGARSPSASGFHTGISGTGNSSPTPDIRSHAQATALVAQTRAAILDAAEDDDDLELEEQLARLGETIELEKRFARGEAQRRVWGLREEDTPIVVGSPIERPRLAAAARTQSGGNAATKGTHPVTPNRAPTGGTTSEPATIATESTITPGATFRSPRTATLDLGSQTIHVASPTPIGATLTLPSASPGKTSFGDPYGSGGGAMGLGLQVDVPPHRQAIALEVQPPSALPTPSTSPHPNDAHNDTTHGFGTVGELAGSASTNASSSGSGLSLGGRTRTTSSTIGALPTSSSTGAAPSSGTTASLGSKLGRIMSNSNASSSADMTRWMGGSSLTRVVTAPTTASGEPPPMHGRKASLTGSTMADATAPAAPSSGGGGLRSRLGGLRKVFGGGKGKA